MSKVTLLPDREAYYEKMGKSGRKIFFENRSWKSILIFINDIPGALAGKARMKSRSKRLTESTNHDIICSGRCQPFVWKEKYEYL